MACGGKVIPFTREEIDFVIMNHNTMSKEEMSKILNRSQSGIAKIIRENNLQKVKPWTNEEDAFLVDNYDIMSDCDIAKKLKKSLNSIKSRAGLLGIRRQSNATPWSNEQVEILKDNYGKIDNKILSQILGRDVVSIRNKAIKLNLTSQGHECWDDSELKILINNYGNIDIKELVKMLPNRKERGIISKANSMGLKTESIQWSNGDINILKSSSLCTLDEISLKLNDSKKTVDAVYRKMTTLRLPYIKSKGIKIGELCKCGLCKKVMVLNNDNFNVNVKNIQYKCKECLRKLGNVRKYKNKYNLDLDMDKMFQTYTVKQWVNMYIDRKINNIPKEIMDDDIEYKKILKEFLSRYVDITNKLEVVNFNSHTIPDGFTIINNYAFKKYGNINDFLIDIFPEFNLKGWDFPMVKKGFFENRDNFKSYMEFFIKDELGYNLDECHKFYKYFNSSFLECSKYGRINSYKKFHGYDTFYHMLYDFFGDVIKKEYFINYFIADDGTNLDSNEELLVYEFIKNNITNKVKTTNRKRRYSYLNKGETYIPDFIIPCKDKSKKVIIEYFGLYNENTKEDSIYYEYLQKSNRKIEYFNSLDDVYFIPLFKWDIKNNFEGVRNKLASFYM